MPKIAQHTIMSLAKTIESKISDSLSVLVLKASIFNKIEIARTSSTWQAAARVHVFFAAITNC